MGNGLYCIDRDIENMAQNTTVLKPEIGLYIVFNYLKNSDDQRDMFLCKSISL